MAKRRYNFGKQYFANFYSKHMLVVVMPDGRELPIWKKKHADRDAQMRPIVAAWARQMVASAQPKKEEPIVEVTVRDVEAQEPRETPESETDETVSVDDGGTEASA